MGRAVKMESSGQIWDKFWKQELMIKFGVWENQNETKVELE